MKKNVIVALILLLIGMNLYSEELVNDLFQVEYKQKNARQAMLFSALIPGTGQLYGNPFSLTAYIFPLLEIGLWYGYFYYRSEGDDINKQYEQYANQHYTRDYQYEAQRSLINNPLSDLNFYAPDDYDPLDTEDYGNGGHFRLDEENTQHFYEDIGKYNKYIFGWDDWVDIYATMEGSITWTGPHWIIEENQNGEGRWVGNDPINSESIYYNENQSLYDNAQGIYSVLRADYNEMRQEAEDHYDNKRLCTYGILFNHLIAAIDAARVTRKYNIDHLSQNHWNLKVSPIYTGGQVSPAVLLTYKF